jgi:acyl dehydratase
LTVRVEVEAVDEATVTFVLTTVNQGGAEVFRGYAAARTA